MKKILLLLVFLLNLLPITLSAQDMYVELDEVVCEADDLIPCPRCQVRMTAAEWCEHDCGNTDLSHCPFCQRILKEGETCDCRVWECVGGSSSGNSSSGGNGSFSGIGSSSENQNPSTPNPSGSTYNKTYAQNLKAINWLYGKAHSKSTGYCSKYVFNALDIGAGKELYSLPRPRYAKDAGPYLLQRGYEEIPNTSNPEMGDVRVWQPYPSQKSQAGHIDIFDGNQWISDFFEPQNTPGPGYRSYPDYKTYRKK